MYMWRVPTLFDLQPLYVPTGCPVLYPQSFRSRCFLFVHDPDVAVLHQNLITRAIRSPAQTPLLNAFPAAVHHHGWQCQARLRSQFVCELRRTGLGVPGARQAVASYRSREGISLRERVLHRYLLAFHRQAVLFKGRTGGFTAAS